MKRILLALGCLVSANVAIAQDSLFTFHGRVTDGAVAANGLYDLRFELHSAPTGATSLSGTIQSNALPVTNGLFAVNLDFGSAPFTGAPRWIEIGVRTNSSLDPFTTLVPRIRLTSVPYAIRAATAGHVNGTSGLRLEPNSTSPNVIGGFNSNRVAVGVVGATIAGGGDAIYGPNVITSNYAAIGGGHGNEVRGEASALAGGHRNKIYSNGSFIGGGSSNSLSADSLYSVVSGGAQNNVEGFWSVIGGGRANEILDVPVTTTWAATIGGGELNSVSAAGSTIAGGAEHEIGAQSTFSTIAGGRYNRIYSSHAAIGGGNGNVIGPLAVQAFIGSGFINHIDVRGEYGVIGGGFGNRIQSNTLYAAILGGYRNDIGTNAFYAAVAGGRDNEAKGAYSFAAGRRALAQHGGAFVWADSTDADFSSSRSNEFAVRAEGGVFINSPRGIALNPADRPLITRGFDPFASGNYSGLGRWGLFMEPHAITLGMPAIVDKKIRFAKYNADSTHTELGVIDQNGDLFLLGTVNPPSDRNVKTNFTAIDARQVLERVLKLPIQTWSYTNHPAVRHIGPVAQDFHEAFKVGADDKHISTIDADGVALAAIQGLHQLLQETRKELSAKDKEIQQLKEVVRALVQRADEPASAKPAGLRTGL